MPRTGQERQFWDRKHIIRALSRSFDPRTILKNPLVYARFAHHGTARRYPNTLVFARLALVWGSKTHRGAIKNPSCALESPSCRRDPRSRTDRPIATRSNAIPGPRRSEKMGVGNSPPDPSESSSSALVRVLSFFRPVPKPPRTAHRLPQPPRRPKTRSPCTSPANARFAVDRPARPGVQYRRRNNWLAFLFSFCFRCAGTLAALAWPGATGREHGRPRRRKLARTFPGNPSLYCGIVHVRST